LDFQEAREELRLGRGSAVELQMGDQLGATAHLLQTLQQVLLLVAVQAEVADPASLATQETAETAELTVARGAVGVQGLTTWATQELAATAHPAL
jgi:uncharacterized protein involved in type VI secretion and phage assembly